MFAFDKLTRCLPSLFRQFSLLTSFCVIWIVVSVMVNGVLNLGFAAVLIFRFRKAAMDACKTTSCSVS